jgi:quercetin dioxygenase-like cupin family protein
MTRFQKTCISLGLALGVFAAVPALAAPEAAMTKDLADMPGKEAISFIVDFPPGSVDPVHRHDAHAFVYVLEGSIVMGVKGGREVTLTPGQTFHEGPADIHTVGRNASATKPAKFLVTMVKDKGVPLLTLVK